MKDMVRLYDRLDNDERVRLFFEAAARQDIEELDRLNDTCPQKTYRGEDWNYTRKKHRIYDATLIYKIGNDRAVIGALLALVGFLIYDNDDDVESCAEVFHRAISVYKGRQLAWQQFCDRLGMAGDILVKAVGMEDAYANEFLTSLDMGLEVEPDTEAQARCHELLTTIIS